VDRLTLGPVSWEQQSEILFTRGLPAIVLPERESRERSVVLYSPGAESIAIRVAAAADTDRLCELGDREEAKTLPEVARLYRWLSDQQLGRHDTVIGVGGGSATDVAGYVASTWLRGVESILVPTTLLGAVDAAIGGKTGINFEGKNRIGTFHLPTRVIIDIESLEKLPAALQREGIAEALKAGYVGDSELVAILQSSEPPLAEVVRRAVAVKADVVGSDFRESDRRAILNFGHTIGHAVEILAAMPHGLAVAVGMVAAATISAARFGFDSRGLVETVFGLGLPVAAAGVSAGPALDLIQKDKKRSREGTRMVLLRDVGDPVVEPVPVQLLELGLAAVGIA
jgi:3-dehydroquinate synthetase